MPSSPDALPSFDERAEQLVALANSEHLGVDELGSATAVAPWWAALTGERLADAEGDSGLAQLHALRRVVHASALRNNPAIEGASAPTGGRLLRLDLTIDADGKAALVAAGGDDTVAMVCAALAQSLLVCSEARDWRRVRACAAPDCRWVFVDRSRNASRRWCDMGSCGTRAKVRSHRSRRAAAPSRQHT